MKTFEYTVTTDKPFGEAVEAVQTKAAENGFRVLYTHDVAATLAEKGFPREPLNIVEICNARYASEVLKKDVKLSLMLPCPISVYVEEGKTYLSTLLPTSITEFFPAADIDQLATEVESTVLKIVDEAK
ncbi:MAG TPA: DUF302 domain-containing protein [Pyrinomonadaceae bacterium]|jgi:uncharacterized protein (DUF302 family)|nr:DUF302 domain-containing protein [Acidobacteriota bacterium]HQZ97998.1 DUF302 domain-containing protein [Pyrinomonadaceae bacterium]